MTETGRNQTQFRLEIITLTLVSTNLLGGYRYLGPAFDVAFEDLRVQHPRLSVSHRLLLDVRHSACDEWLPDTEYTAAAAVLNSTSRPDLRVFVHGGCGDTTGLAVLMGQLDMLLVTSVAALPPTIDIRKTPTWISTSTISFNAYRRIYGNLVTKYSWKSVVIIRDVLSNSFFITVTPVVETFLRKQLKIQVITFALAINSTASAELILWKLSDATRVCIFFGERKPFRLLMLAASKLGMTKGDYVFVNIWDPTLVTPLNMVTWNTVDILDEEVQLAFRSVIYIALDSGEETQDNHHFVEDMKIRSKRDYNYTYRADESVTSHPASTYMALMVLAQIVNEHASQENQSSGLMSGRFLAGLLLNRTFATRIGKLRIDERNERAPAMHVFQHDWITGKLRLILDQASSGVVLREVDAPLWPAAWPVSSEPPCREALCATGTNSFFVGGLAAGLLALMAVACMLGWIARKRLQRNGLYDDWWIMDEGKLQTSDTIKASNEGRAAVYKNGTVWISPIAKEVLNRPTILTAHMFQPEVLHLLRGLRSFAPVNVNRFLGIALVHSHNLYLASAVCERGSLWDLLERIQLDSDFQYSLLSDAAQGLLDIHRSKFAVHGDLTSHDLLIDRYFTGKLGRTCFCTLEKALSGKTVPYKRKKVEFWTAPELWENLTAKPEPPCDIYCFGGILLHVMSQKPPALTVANGTLELDAASADQLAPCLSNADSFPDLWVLFDECRQAPPQSRPSAQVILRRLRKNFAVKSRHKSGASLIDRILYRFESYADELDSTVAQRTIALLEERKKCDILLREILPSTVIEEMRKGSSVHAEMFEAVTILFSEIIGLAELVYSKPVTFLMHALNEVYTVFDTALSRYSVYKVETIGSVYMVASGLPVDIGELHVRECCRVSKALMQAFSSLSVSVGTSVRIGLSSGPCAAGVVGHKAPRYCVFGDTVNTASRMLLHGQDSKIHVSQSTANLLSEFPEFRVEERGLIEVKGKGLTCTFWPHYE